MKMLSTIAAFLAALILTGTPVTTSAMSTGPDYEDQACDSQQATFEHESLMSRSIFGQLEFIEIDQGDFHAEIIDGDGYGYNDPVFGPARTAALTEVLSRMSDLIVVTVPIHIQVGFAESGGSESGGSLGFANVQNWHHDFSGAPLAGTWYPAALANQHAGVDLLPGVPDGFFRMNDDVDQATLFCGDWYYGVDGLPPTHPVPPSPSFPSGRTCTDFDFLTVATHELAHALGMTTLTSKSTGAFDGGFPDNTARHFQDDVSDLLWPDIVSEPVCGTGHDGFLRRLNGMSVTQMLFSGPESDDACLALTGGCTDLGGGSKRLQMYAPSSVSFGSSWSHVTTAVSPNNLMEPFYIGPAHDTALIGAILNDMGYGGPVVTTTSTTTSTTTTVTAPASSTTTTTVVEEGTGFDCPATFRFESAAQPVAGLTFNVDYDLLQGEFLGSAGTVQCTPLVPGALLAAFDCDADATCAVGLVERTLRIGTVINTEFPPGTDLATCIFRVPPASPQPVAANYLLSILEAVGPDLQDVTGPVVSVSVGVCTTVVVPTTTTTLPPPTTTTTLVEPTTTTTIVEPTTTTTVVEPTTTTTTLPEPTTTTTTVPAPTTTTTTLPEPTTTTTTLPPPTTTTTTSTTSTTLVPTTTTSTTTSTLPQCIAPIPGDFNGDGVFNDQDLLDMAEQLGLEITPDILELPRLRM